MWVHMSKRQLKWVGWINDKPCRIGQLIHNTYTGIYYFVDPDPGYCGPGWTYDPTSYYCYKLVYDPQVSWDEAHAACLVEDEGSDLASINSMAEQTYINGMKYNVFDVDTVGDKCVFKGYFDISYKLIASQANIFIAKKSLVPHCNEMWLLDIFSPWIFMV